MTNSQAVHRIILLLLVLSCIVWPAESSKIEKDRDAAFSPLAPAREVLRRVVGNRANEFRLSLIAGETHGDRYELSASRGIVTIRGTSTIALTRAVYDYLRSTGIGMVTWSGQRIELPKRLPDCPLSVGSTPFQFREYFNVCTFGYTTVWWDWDRWERELDWMALHGINMPLAMVGQEAVWTRLWTSYGVTRNELNDFFTGPAFLPWQRMGNINKHGGPLSDEWMEDQRVLQHRIVKRMRELGMVPIAPAFSGFIPPAFKRVHPEAVLTENSHWGNFPDGYQTFVLAPGSPLFADIGRRFIQEYEREYGPFHYYLADTFNELTVPVSADTNRRYDELAAFGRAVFSSISAGDSNATWVMQGWMFVNDQDFWDRASVRALLRDVPDDRVMILDLANEIFEGWRAHNSFNGKRWISSVIHNFGGNNPLYGDLKFFAGHWADVLRDSTHGALAGIGMAPEGIENNEVIYELLTDAAWSDTSIDLKTWIRSYVQCRYGGIPEPILHAWDLLLDHVYTHSSLNFKHAFQNRPSRNPPSDVKDSTSLRQIVELFLTAGTELKRSVLFRNDLIEVAAHYGAVCIDAKLLDACLADEAGKGTTRDTLAAEALMLMRGLDALLASRTDMQLDRWIAQARSHGGSAAAKDLLEYNARLQVTIWGGPDLFDYASKLWSGLIRDFYAMRWKLFFEALSDGKSDEEARGLIVRWEESWTRQETLTAVTPPNDVVHAVRDFLTRIDRTMRLTPVPLIIADRIAVLKNDSIKVSMKSTYPDAVIRYTLDGTEPSSNGPLYRAPIFVHGSAVVKAKSFLNGWTESLPVNVEIYQIDSSNGIVCKYFEVAVTSLAGYDLRRFQPVRRKVVYSFDPAAIDPRKEDYIESFETVLDVTVAGDYRFCTESDDGSCLYVDGLLVVDNDGCHALRTASGTVKLTHGRHPLLVQFFQARGADVLRVMYSGPGFTRQAIDPSKCYLSSDR